MDYWMIKKRLAASGSFWWSPDGVSDTDCLAAYRFTARNSEIEAKKDLLGKSGDIANSGCSWSAGNGYYINNTNCLDQSTLRSSGIKSIVLKIANVWAGNYMALTGNWGGVSVWLKTPFDVQSYATKFQNSGVCHANGSPSTQGADAVRLMSGELSAGIIGLTNTGRGVLYYNGSSVSLHNGTDGSNPWTRFRAADIPRLVGGAGNTTSASGTTVLMNGYFYVRAIAVYSKELSAAEQLRIYQNMQFI